MNWKPWLVARPGAWAIVVDDVADDIEVGLSPSAARLAEGGRPPLTFPLPPPAVPVDLSRAGARLRGRRCGRCRRLEVSWPRAAPLWLGDADHDAELRGATDVSCQRQRLRLVPETADVELSAETRYAAFKEGCRALDAKLDRMHSLYNQMNSLAREKIIGQSGPADVEVPVPTGATVDSWALDGLHIEEDIVLGRCLVTDRAWQEQEMLLRERPCIILGLQCLMPGEKEDLRRSWEGLTPEQRSLLDGFESHVGLATEYDRQRFALSEFEVAELEERGIPANKDCLLRYWMVQRVNAHRFDFGTALFARASKASHSCRPNCRAIEQDGAIELWTLRELAAGEHIFISYIQEEDELLADTELRRRHLWDKFCFVCQCKRCCEPDPSRCFRCPCGGDVAALDSVGGSSFPCLHKDIVPERWGCGKCWRVMNSADPWIADCLGREHKLTMRWKQLKEDVGMISGKIVSIQAFVALWLEESRHRTTDNWTMIWEEVRFLREDLAFAPGHWLAGHAALLASGLALARAAQGHGMPVSEGDIASDVGDFVQMALRLCPEVSYALNSLMTEVTSMLRLHRAGALTHDADLLGNTAALLGRWVERSWRLDEMD